MANDTYGLIPVMACKCSRCGNVWLPRDPDHLPVACGKCKSAYWNRPRTAPKTADTTASTQAPAPQR